MSVTEKFMLRLLELFREDEELHSACVELLRARARAEDELADWRKRRS